MATGAALAAPAGFASADNGAQTTINYWEQQGYQVNIDRVGSGPINECVVTSVRNPNTITRFVRVGGKNDNTSELPGPSDREPHRAGVAGLFRLSRLAAGGRHSNARITWRATSRISFR